MKIDRDCKNCKHMNGLYCQSWNCSFEPRNISDYICGECKYLRMSYDRGGWEVYYCDNEKGRGTDDVYGNACSAFEMTDEAIKEYFERLNAENG